MTSHTALDTAATAAQACAELAGVEWDEVEDAALCEAAVAAARLRALADATLVRLAARLEETGAADRLGWASTKDFLTHALGGHKGAGATYVRVAKQTRDLPRVRAAMAEGELSLAQASVIGTNTTRLPAVDDLRERAADLLVDLAHTEQRDATDLDRAFPDVVDRLDPDGELLAWDNDKPRAERSAHHARFLTLTRDKLGGVRIKGYATLEDAELVKATLMPLAAPVTTTPCGGDRFHRHDEQGRRIKRGCPDPHCGHDGRDHRESGARLWDALVEACRRLQNTDTLPHDHGTTARITVTTTLENLRAQLSGTGTSTRGSDGLLPSGDRLSAAAVRRLACDAEIIPAVLGAHGQVLDLGRTTRLVTTGLWHALVLRDQHCIFPGCDRLPIACEAHHITHWADGGPTTLDNLVLVCRKHHTAIHATPWTVAIAPTTRRPRWSPPPPPPPSDARGTYIPARARPPGHAA